MEKMNAKEFDGQSNLNKLLDDNHRINGGAG